MKTHRINKIVFTILAVLLLLMPLSRIEADTWPAYNHDNQRSAVSAEQLKFPLSEHWTYRPALRPAHAWPDPARTDIWHQINNLKARADYDRANHVTSDGGNIYFASSADDRIYSLNAETGEMRWDFCTGGPVRFAPALHNGKVYAGSDDGCIYCLDSGTGDLIWKYDPGLTKRKIPGNGRIISACPIRTGVVIEDNIVYAAAGIFPSEGVSLFALNAENGSLLWENTGLELSPQGHLLASSEKLYVPTGRTAPSAFERSSGKLEGAMQAAHGDGGTFALIADDRLISGPGNKLAAYSAQTRDKILTFDGMRMIVDGSAYYLLSADGISAYDLRKLEASRTAQQVLITEKATLADSLKTLTQDTESGRKTADKVKLRLAAIAREIRSISDNEHEWKIKADKLSEMILVGGALITGGDGSVTAYDTGTGDELWQSAVDGRAYGLAIAEGRLFVSTDKGVIHTFSSDPVNAPRVIRQTVIENPFRDDKEQQKFGSDAEQILASTDQTKGYCVVLSCGNGRLMYELAMRSDFHIIGIDSRKKNVEDARRQLHNAGLYGSRVTVLNGTLDSISLPDNFANIVCSGGNAPLTDIAASPDNIVRLLRPYGGVAVIGGKLDVAEVKAAAELKVWLSSAKSGTWSVKSSDRHQAIYSKGTLEGGGQWTHQYSDAANSNASSDTIIGMDVNIQWFGRPGPKHINDRHHRPMAPLFCNGRLFIVGNDRLFGMDAYNGTMLWERDVPGFRRIGVMRSAGHVVASEEYLYIAKDAACRALDTNTGDDKLSFSIPGSASDGLDWGYTAVMDGKLIGSSIHKGAALTELSVASIGNTYYDVRPLIASDRLFSLDRFTGETNWIYANGNILTPTITVSSDAVYFVETLNENADPDKDGRITVPDAFFNGTGRLVKLDIETGKIIWSRPLDSILEHVIFLALKDSMLVLTGSYNKDNELHYGLRGLDAKSGRDVWSNSYVHGSVLNGGHGEQDQHPVITGGTIYSRPFAFDLYTGIQKNFTLVRGGHGCGTISGCEGFLFGRGGFPRIYDLSGDGSINQALSRVNRPGCYVNLIPAGGLVILPESSSGCTCGYPIQMSVAYSSTNVSQTTR